ncbi:hypothetical protein [Clostridium tyrobutyricum]|uniref:hypothetical protein n=1 Tax=Clostridium tyrobutyricum TaxID=1519 RepID=UPI001C38FE3D|nr:hypothetical protein [Clostridium tyrobutyricum]MBV4421454.1 hypothetical protein [Clostridium tyrobutyricum]MBV4436535.1 hypothetical protein [Clostridium tyrobutyricum]
MKSTTLNKRNLGVTIIIIGLIIILFIFGNSFQKRLRYTVLIQNNISSLSEYSELNGKLKYKLPSKWHVKRQDIFGRDIICHTDFISDDNKVIGFFETWNFKGNLKEFLINSKLISDKQNLYKTYYLNSISIGQKNGYLLKYTITKPVGDSYVCNEYFIKDGDRFYRFSFFMRQSDFKDDMETIFKAIVETLRYD